MDPITPWRYVCLLSSVKSKERREEEEEEEEEEEGGRLMHAGLSLSVDTGAKTSTSLLGHYCQRF